MISVTEARQIIEETSEVLSPVSIPLPSAGGLVLAAPVYAPFNIPAFPQSGVDGYALYFDGTRWPFKIVGEISAGSHQHLSLKKGEAVRIFTGAPLPHGANTVLMQERATVADGLLTIQAATLVPGDNVRPVGSEIFKEMLALPAGTLLTPPAVGFLAGIGITDVSVFPLPKVSLIITGNELQTPGNLLEYGQVYESNSLALLSALKEIAIEPIAVYRCVDDLALLTEILLNALEDSDVVLITGGVSVGDYDFTAIALDACEVQTVFHKVKQKPGKPMLFGLKDDKLIFGLPGNPASVLTCYYQYVLTAISKMCSKSIGLKVVEASLKTDLKKAVGLTQFLKGYFDGIHVEIPHGQESYKLNSFAKANCFVEISEETTAVLAGEKVAIHLFC